MLRKMYLLPAAISLGAHAFIFLDPHSTSKPPVVLPPHTTCTEFTLEATPPEPVPADDSYTSAPAPKGNPMPGLEEMLSTATTTSCFLMEVPYTGPRSGATTLTIGFVGRPDGIGTEYTGNNFANNTAIDFSKLDNHPRTRYQAQVQYPHSARSAGLEGSVTMEFTVDEKGLVIAPRIVSSTDNVFNEPALQSIAKWRFEPGRLHGKTVPYKMRLPMSFTINNSEF